MRKQRDCDCRHQTCCEEGIINLHYRYICIGFNYRIAAIPSTSRVHFLVPRRIVHLIPELESFSWMPNLIAADPIQLWQMRKETDVTGYLNASSMLAALETISPKACRSSLSKVIALGVALCFAILVRSFVLVMAAKQSSHRERDDR